MRAKIAVMAIVLSALAAGAGLYYLQVYAYYDEVSAVDIADVQLTSLISGTPEPILFENFQAIDSDSSPIRYRACFDTPHSQAALTEEFVTYELAEPLVAPDWFDCFDAQTIGEQLKTGEAIAFLGQENIHYGIDRIIAVMGDGRAFAWQQINACGEMVFNGEPVPAGCPTPPEGGL